MIMDNTQQPEKIMSAPIPPVKRFERISFMRDEDYELYTMMCDDIDAGINCDFYRQAKNQGFVKMPDGSRRQYFLK